MSHHGWLNLTEEYLVGTCVVVFDAPLVELLSQVSYGVIVVLSEILRKQGKFLFRF